MRVCIRLFAVARDLAGRDAISLEMSEASTVGQMRGQLAAEVPALAAVLPQVLFAIGSAYAQDETVIPANADVACIPPVSGG